MFERIHTLRRIRMSLPSYAWKKHKKSLYIPPDFPTGKNKISGQYAKAAADDWQSMTPAVSK